MHKRNLHLLPDWWAAGTVLCADMCYFIYSENSFVRNIILASFFRVIKNHSRNHKQHTIGIVRINEIYWLGILGSIQITYIISTKKNYLSYILQFWMLSAKGIYVRNVEWSMPRSALLTTVQWHAGLKSDRVIFTSPRGVEAWVATLPDAGTHLNSTALALPNKAEKGRKKKNHNNWFPACPLLTLA